MGKEGREWLAELRNSNLQSLAMHILGYIVGSITVPGLLTLVG